MAKNIRLSSFIMESAILFYSVSLWCLVTKVAECRHDVNIDTQQVRWEATEGADNRGEYFIGFDVRNCCYSIQKPLALYHVLQTAEVNIFYVSCDERQHDAKPCWA